MANTAISDIGSQIQMSGGSEHIEPAVSGGSIYAGMCVYFDKDDSYKAKPIDANSATAGLSFIGIVDRHYSIGLDDAITAGVVCNVLVPKSGRLYNVFIEDFGAAGPKGSPLTFGTTTAGSLMLSTGTTGNLESTANIVAYLEKAVANEDTVALVRWA